MYVVVILEAAHEDLRNIVAYIGNENPDAAESLGHELLDEAMSLESLPYRGSRVRKRRSLLKLIHGNYLIYYRIKEQKQVVEIVALKHVAQVNPSYARQMSIAPGMARASLRGVVLSCDPYDPASLNFEGSYGGFMRMVIWAYLGTRDPHDPRVRELSVISHVTAAYPPVFIPVGNADPLAPQSVAFAEALHDKGVEVDALFFPHDHDPPLEHEYQMLLSSEAGRLAFERLVAFLTAHAR